MKKITALRLLQSILLVPSTLMLGLMACFFAFGGISLFFGGINHLHGVSANPISLSELLAFGLLVLFLGIIPTLSFPLLWYLIWVGPKWFETNKKECFLAIFIGLASIILNIILIVAAADKSNLNKLSNLKDWLAMLLFATPLILGSFHFYTLWRSVFPGSNNTK